MEQINEFDLDKKVTVRSIAPWKTTFPRVTEAGGVVIAPNGTARISRNEIIAQHQTGNRLFNGVDGIGSHATLFIDDEATRREIGFESEDGKVKQNVFSDDLVKKVFEYKSQQTFESHFKEAFITRSEKYAAIEAIKRLKINDYSKIRFVENYTGYKVQ